MPLEQRRQARGCNNTKSKGLAKGSPTRRQQESIEAQPRRHAASSIPRPRNRDAVRRSALRRVWPERDGRIESKTKARRKNEKCPSSRMGGMC